MEEEIKELLVEIINTLKIGISNDPIYYILYLNLLKLLEEYYSTVLVEYKSNHLRMKHLLNDIKETSDALSSKPQINKDIKSLVAKLIKFHKVIFEFNYVMKLEAIHYKKEIFTYLKADFKIKKLLTKSLYQARHNTTLSIRLADKVENDWREINNQLCEKSILMDRVISIFERGKYIELLNVIGPLDDSFIVFQITIQSLINSILNLSKTSNLTKLDKFELKTAIDRLMKFKNDMPKAKETHNKILNRVREYIEINKKYNPK